MPSIYNMRTGTSTNPSSLPDDLDVQPLNELGSSTVPHSLSPVYKETTNLTPVVNNKAIDDHQTWPHKMLRYANEFFSLARKVSALAIIIVSAYLIAMNKTTQHREENMLELLQHMPREFVRQLPSEFKHARKTYIFLPLFSSAIPLVWKQFIDGKEHVELFSNSFVFFDTNMAPMGATTTLDAASISVIGIGHDGKECDYVLNQAAAAVFLHTNDRTALAASNLGLALVPQQFLCFADVIGSEYTVWYLKLADIIQ